MIVRAQHSSIGTPCNGMRLRRRRSPRWRQRPGVGTDQSYASRPRCGQATERDPEPLESSLLFGLLTGCQLQRESGTGVSSAPTTLSSRWAPSARAYRAVSSFM